MENAVETISQDDLQFLREAIAQQNQATGNRAFVEDFIARKYGFKTGDSIDATTAMIKRLTVDDDGRNDQNTP